MKLRPAQEDAFRDHAFEHFKAQGVAHLRRDLSKQTKDYSDDNLKMRIDRCVPRANQYGLQTQREIMCFVDATFLIGEWFDKDEKHKWALEVLNSKKLAAGDRANLLLATACSFYQEKHGE